MTRESTPQKYPKLTAYLTHRERAALDRFCRVHDRKPSWVVRRALKSIGAIPGGGK